MAFNSSTNKVATKRLVKVLETKVSGRVNIMDEKVIDRTLDGFGVVNIVTEDKVGENLLFSGNVNFTALYLSGEKVIESCASDISFNERITLGEVDAITLVPTIKSAKVVKESDKGLAINLVIETKIYGVIFEEVALMVGEDEGFYTETSQVVTNNLTASTSTSFTVTEKIETMGAKVLGVTAFTNLSKVTPFDNYVTMEGSVVVDYITQADDQVKKLSKTIDFSEEVPVLNMTPELIIDYLAFTKNVSTVFDAENGDDLVVDVNVSVGVWGFNKTSMVVIRDAFSDQKIVNLTYSSFDNNEIAETKIFSERKTLVIEQESKKRLDEVLMVGAVSSSVNEIRVEDSLVTIKGTSSATVVYKNYDSDDTLSTTISSPFELSVPVSEREGELVSNVELTSRVNSYKNKAGKDITLTVDYEGVVFILAETKEQYVSNIEEVKDIPKNRSSIVVYKPKHGESVFDVAKALAISPDVLLSQNPQIEDDKVTSQVVVYRRCK